MRKLLSTIALGLGLALASPTAANYHYPRRENIPKEIPRMERTVEYIKDHASTRVKTTSYGWNCEYYGVKFNEWDLSFEECKKARYRVVSRVGIKGSLESLMIFYNGRKKILEEAEFDGKRYSQTKYPEKEKIRKKAINLARKIESSI